MWKRGKHLVLARRPARATGLGRWIRWVSCGELAGFCVPAAVGALAAESRQVALVGVAGGAAMAVSMSPVAGLWLRRRGIL